MNKNNIISVVRVFLALVCWYLVNKFGGGFVDSLLEGRVPDIVRMVAASMVIPYTVALGAFFLVTLGMKEGPVEDAVSTPIKLDFSNIVKYFVIQTGIAFPGMFVINIVLTVMGKETGGTTPEKFLTHPVFYVVLLLIFNPIFEELLFRKFVLERISGLGFKWAVIVSAVLFAMPHLLSQGPAQVPYTFALGLVWAYVTVRSKKLWPAVVLHSLSNLYGAFIPMIVTAIHPALSVVYVMFTMGVVLPAAIILMVYGKRNLSM